MLPFLPLIQFILLFITATFNSFCYYIFEGVTFKAMRWNLDFEMKIRTEYNLEIIRVSIKSIRKDIFDN